MPFSLCTFRRLALLGAVSLGWALGPGAEAGTLSAGGQGSAAFQKKKQSPGARDDALRAALQDAVRKALADKLTREQLLTYNEAIETQVLPLAKALVSRYSVVDERVRNKLWEVTVRAQVDEEMLMENLELIGFDMDVGSRRSVAVVIEEYYSSDLPPNGKPFVSRVTEREKSDSRHDVEVPGHLLTAAGQAAAAEAATTALPPATNLLPEGFGPSGTQGLPLASPGEDYFESKRTKQFEERVVEYFPPEVIERPRPDPASAAAIGRALLERDVRLIDAGRAASIRDEMIGADGWLLPVLSDPVALSSRSMKLGAMAGTDAVMVGTTAIVYSGMSGARHKAEATLSVRIVDTSTGDIVAYTTATEVGLGTNSEAAASAAADRLGTRLGKEMGEQLFQYWRDRDEKGVEISLNMVGVTSTPTSLAIGDALKRVKGSKSVTQRFYDRTSGLLVLTVTTKRPLGEYKGDLLRALYEIPELQTMEEEASVGANWNLVVHPPPPPPVPPSEPEPAPSEPDPAATPAAGN